MREKLMKKIGEQKIVAIVRGVSSRHIVEVGKALLAGGVSMVEVTFDHAGSDGIVETLASLSLLKSELGGELSFGAGTVLTEGEVVEAHKRGAEYIISPNVDAAVIAKTKELGMLSMPGAFTPTEIVSAHRMGADIVKIFPAVIGGVDYVKAVRGPLAHIPMAAVGGVEPGNVADFLKAGIFCFGIGSNLVNAKKVAAGDFASITETAKAFNQRLGALN